MRELALGLALAVVFVGASGGCTLLLDTDGANPHSCNIDADCAQLPNAVCDNARRVCVPRLPSAGDDGGVPPIDGGDADTGGGLMCELAFDNAARITMSGPDGGLRPLPEEP
jgi:hypothetical protein